MTALFAFVLKLLSGPLVDRVVGYLETRAKLEGNRDKLRAEIEIETIRQGVQIAAIMASAETARYQVGWYWLFVGIFIVPLALWWAAVILDSIFRFTWDVAALPAPLDEWAGTMIAWLFLIGSARLAIGGRR